MNKKCALIKRFFEADNTRDKLTIAGSFNALIAPQKLVPPTTHTEVWRDIMGYEGIYQVSSFGRVRSIERFFIKNKRGGKEKMAVYQSGCIRTSRYDKNGYLKISLWNNNSVKWFSMHRLVAIHFNDNPNNYPQVLHMDDNTKNARWDNLEWGTQSKNIQDSFDRGRNRHGSKNNKAKLTEADIPKIRELINNGLPSPAIGKMYGVVKSTILSIKHNKCWKHVKQ
jgi:hypothetical protein